MTIGQILSTANDIAHVYIDCREAGAVEGRRHLHLAVDALLAQDRYARTMAGGDKGRGNVGVAVVTQLGR